MIAEGARIAAHRPDRSDELRIIAGEHGSLDKCDRDVIRAASDEMEALTRDLYLTRAQLIEASWRLIAVNDQLLVCRQREIELIETMAAMKRGETKPQLLHLSVELGRWTFQNTNIFGPQPCR